MKTDNELIAEFMGGQAHKIDNGFGETKVLIWFLPGNHPNPHCNAGTYKSPSDLEYHKRWDWLHPVIDKIGKLYSVAFPPNERFIQMILDKENLPVEKHLDVIALPLGTPIQEAYKAVVDFIKWHNEQKTL